LPFWAGKAAVVGTYWDSSVRNNDTDIL